MTVDPQNQLSPAALQLTCDELRGRYEILEEIGAGGMSVLYKARHLLMDKLVVIKLLNASFLGESKHILRFQTEAKAASKLSHTNIVKVTDFGVTADGVPFIVMDYVEGESLAAIIAREKTLPFQRAIALSLQICQALEEAHKHGILHRDLKPANIMVQFEPDGSETPKIVDFGIAKLGDDEQSLTGTGEVFGTPLYMSPEQCQGMQVDARSDQYSLGCIIYELLSGAPPFMADTPLELAQKHLKEKPPPLAMIAQCPAGFESILLRTLAKDPQSRYPTIAELRKSILSVSETRGGGHKTATAAFAALAVIVIVALGMFAFAGRQLASSRQHLDVAEMMEKLGKKNTATVVGGIKFTREEGNGNTFIVATAADTTDADMKSLSQLKLIRVLDIRKSGQITDAGMDCFKGAPSLEEIYIDANNDKISDAIFSTIGTLNIRKLFIASSHLNPGRLLVKEIGRAHI